jgi:hypothetical protein
VEPSPKFQAAEYVGVPPLTLATKSTFSGAAPTEGVADSPAVRGPLTVTERDWRLRCPTLSATANWTLYAPGFTYV